MMGAVTGFADASAQARALTILGPEIGAVEPPDR